MAAGGGYKCSININDIQEVQLFNEMPKDNFTRTNGGSTIITMNSANFRRDEIWFAAKNIDEETQLYSLAEFKDEKGNSVRNDASFSKQYMEGRFGADPFVQKLIQWEVA